LKLEKGNGRKIGGIVVTEKEARTIGVTREGQEDIVEVGRPSPTDIAREEVVVIDTIAELAVIKTTLIVTEKETIEVTGEETTGTAAATSVIVEAVGIQAHQAVPPQAQPIEIDETEDIPRVSIRLKRWKSWKR